MNRRLEKGESGTCAQGATICDCGTILLERWSLLLPTSFYGPQLPGAPVSIRLGAVNKNTYLSDKKRYVAFHGAGNVYQR